MGRVMGQPHDFNQEQEEEEEERKETENFLKRYAKSALSRACLFSLFFIYTQREEANLVWWCVV